MPVLPMFKSPPDPDAWHEVTAPGGYESWRFVAEDPAQGLRLVATLSAGSPFHPEYLRQYVRYLRSPTRIAPPVAAEHELSETSLYLHKTLVMHAGTPRGDFVASNAQPDVRIGPNHFWIDENGEGRLLLFAMSKETAGREATPGT